MSHQATGLLTAEWVRFPSHSVLTQGYEIPRKFVSVSVLTCVVSVEDKRLGAVTANPEPSFQLRVLLAV
jgi:hypothetical protein